MGEHESCGPGNLAVSGFTYNPETFMAAKIGVYNISWRDMGVPTLEKMMDMVQVRLLAAAAAHSSGCAVCASGRGRTAAAGHSKQGQRQQQQQEGTALRGLL